VAEAGEAKKNGKGHGSASRCCSSPFLSLVRWIHDQHLLQLGGIATSSTAGPIKAALREKGREGGPLRKERKESGAMT